MEKEYIKTEKGIYEKIDIRIRPNKYASYGMYRHNLNSDYEQIIDESNSLNDLIDYYVIDWGRGYPKSIMSKEEFQNQMCYSRAKYEKIYGAIWVGLNLVTVADVIAFSGDDVELCLRSEYR